MINKGMIEKEIKYLKNAMNETKINVTKLKKKVPGEYALRAVKHASSAQYFMRKDGRDRNGTYIKKKDRKTAEFLAQIEYDNKLIRILSDEIKALEGLCSLPENNPFISAWDQMSELKKELVKIPYISEEEYMYDWLSQEYEKLGFREDAPEFYSKKGLRVRSKSEILIADILDEYEIPYLYEKPLALSKSLTVHPDFTILDTKSRSERYWEHFGMMDDIEYRNNTFMKIRQYESNGYYLGVNFIWTFETSKYPLNIRNIRNMVCHMQ